MSTRLVAATAAAVFASTGLAVLLTPSPASAATAYCTMMATTNQSTYVVAENYGYGGDGRCHRVRARAWKDHCGGFAVWEYGSISRTESRVEKGSSCSISSRGTAAAPVEGFWTGYSTAGGKLNRMVTT